MLAVCLRLPHPSNKSKQSRSKCWLQMSSVWTSEEEKLFVLLRFKMAARLQTLWKKHHNRHFSVTFLLWDGKRGQIWFCDLLRVLEKVTTNNTSTYETQGLHLSGRRLMVTPRWAKTSQKDVFSTLTAEFAGFKLRVLQCNFSQKHLKNVLWFKIKSFRKTTLHSMQQKLQTGLETVVSNIYFFIDTFQISKTNWRHSVKGAWCAGAEHCSSGSPVCNRLAYLK